jgi:hypothetical protein
VGGSLGLGLERFRDDLLDIRVSDLTWGTRPFLVSESVDPSLDEPAAPLADGLGRDAELGGNPFVVETVGAGQDDPGALGQLLGTLRSRSPGFQGLPFVVVQDQFSFTAAEWHGEAPLRETLPWQGRERNTCLTHF